MKISEDLSAPRTTIKVRVSGDPDDVEDFCEDLRQFMRPEKYEIDYEDVHQRREGGVNAYIDVLRDSSFEHLAIPTIEATRPGKELPE